jgi:hypothetical protein
LTDDRGDLTRVELVEQTGLEVPEDRLQSAPDAWIAV